MSLDATLGEVGTLETMMWEQDDKDTQYTTDDARALEERLRTEVTPKRRHIALAMVDMLARIRQERMNPVTAKKPVLHRPSHQTIASIDTSSDFETSVRLPNANYLLVSQPTESDTEPGIEPATGFRTCIQDIGRTVLQGVSEMFKTHRPAVVGGLAVAAVIATGVAAPVARSIIRRTS